MVDELEEQSLEDQEFTLEQEEEEEDLPYVSKEPSTYKSSYIGLTPSLQAAIIDTESGGNPRAVSRAGARGLMQVMPSMWDAYGGAEKDPFDPATNIDIGSKIYQDEYIRFSGNTELALAAYNAGSPSVISALKNAGYELNDAAYATFDEIKPFLPKETQEYVPNVISKSLAYTEPQRNEDDPTTTEYVGSLEELQRDLAPIVNSPEFVTMRTGDRLAALREVYDSKRVWSDDAEAHMKKLTALAWEYAYPDEKIDYGSLVGPPPKVESLASADEELASWREQKTQELIDSGVNTMFLGNELENYLNNASDYEKQAAGVRDRFKKEDARGVISYGRAGVRGFTSGVLSPIAAIPRVIFGAEETATAIESAADIISDAPIENYYEVTEDGYIKLDEYQRPITRWQGTAVRAVGDAMSILTGGAALKGVGASLKAVGRTVAAANVLKTGNDAYKDAIEVGGTRGEAALASFLSIPSAALDTLGDTFVLGGGKAWLSGLSNYNKARALATGFLIKGPVESVTEAGQQLTQDIGTSVATGKWIPTPERTRDALIGGYFAGGVIGSLTTAMDRMPVPFDREEAPAPPPEQGGTLPALPAPQERLLLPPPSAQAQLPSAYNQLQLPQPEAGINLPQVQAREPITAYDVPSPEEHIRLAQEFQQLQESPEFQKTYILRSPKDVDNDLLRLFGLQGIFTEDGNLQVTKVTTHIPADPKNLAPEGIEARIGQLTQELASSPKPEEAQGLVQRRRELLEELSQIEDKAKAAAPAVAQLSDRQAQLKKNITRLKQNADQPGANQKLISSRLSDARAELREINKFLDQNKEGAKVAKIQNELRRVNNALRDLSDPRFMNNIKAKESELSNLLTTRDIAAQEVEQEKKAKTEAEQAQKIQEENLKRGIGIQSERGVRYVLPFEGKWYVLSDRGNPMTKGYQNFTDALEVASQIVDIENARPSVSPQPITRIPQERPYRFKQRIEVPFTIVTPGPKETEVKAAEAKKVAEAKKKKAPEKKGKVAAKKAKEAPKNISIRDEFDVPLAVRSIKTGNIYSENLSDKLKKLADYWTRGFNLPRTIIGTEADYESGLMDKALTPLQKEWIAAAREKLKDKNVFGSANIVDGKGIVIVKGGDLTYDNAEVLAHEIGHVLKRSILANAPQEIKNKIKNEFLDTLESFKENTTASDLAESLHGPGTEWEDNTTPYKDLSAADKDRLIEGAYGFEEYLANQVREFLLNPDKTPAKGTPESIYKKIYDAFRRLWGSLTNTFRVNKSFEDFMEDYWDADAANRILEAAPPAGVTKVTEIPKGEKERKFSKRVRESEKVEPEVREKVGVQAYQPKTMKEMASQARARVTPDNIDKNIREVTDFDNDFTPDERIAYGIAVVDELNRQIQAAKKAGKPFEELVEKESNLAKALAEEGTSLGRGVKAFSLFPSMTFEGTSNRFEKDLKKILNNKDYVLPENVKADIRKIYERMQAVKAELPEGASADYGDNMILNHLARQMIARAAEEIPTPLTKALSYYWYSNILSGPATHTINTFGSGHELLLRALSTALTMPKSLPAFIDGVAKAVPRAWQAGRATLAGKGPPRGKLKFDIVSQTADKSPEVKLQNELMQALVANPLNFFNKHLKIVGDFLQAQDVFFYTLGANGQAYLAADRALRREGTSPQNFAVRLGEELHNSKNEYKSAEAQSQKEWEASGEKFTPRDVALRAYEIIDQRRNIQIQEAAKRGGELTTFTESPAGLLGAFTKGLEAFISGFAPAKIQFPFVRVVANVLSRMLDYSPIGVARSAAGTHISSVINKAVRGRATDVQFSPEERLQRLGAGLLGTTLLTGVYALANSHLDEDDPAFAVWARGPTNEGEKTKLRAKGWAPYSVKIGNTYVKFSETMLAPVLAWIGELHDAYRYSPSFNKKEPSQQFIFGLAKTSGVILDMGFLRGISRLWQAARGQGNPAELIASPVRGLIPFSGLLKDLAKIVDATELDPKQLESSIARGIPWIQGYYGKPALDSFGEPMKGPELGILSPILGRFISPEKTDPRWDFLTKNGVYVPAMSVQQTVGVKNPTPKQARNIKKNEEVRLEELGRAAYDTLTYEEVYEITKLAGPDISKGIEKLMRGRTMTKDKYQKEIEKIAEAARRKAKIAYFGY